MKNSTATKKEVGDLIDLVRTCLARKKLSQSTIQKSIGWGRSYISQIFTGQKRFGLEALFDLLREIEVSPADFFAELYETEIQEALTRGQILELRERVLALEEKAAG